MANIQRGLIEMFHDFDRRARPGREPKNRAISKFTTLSDTVQLSSDTLTSTVQTPPYQYARQSYRSAVIADTPRAYWRLGENAPNVTANEENGLYAGTYTTGVLLGYNGAGNSEHDLSAAFTSTEKVTAASSSLATDALAAYSIEAWINTQATPNNSPFFVKRLAAGSGTYMYVSSTAGAVNFGRVAGGVTVEVGTSAVASTGSWAHVVGTYDGTTATTAMKIYGNGVKGAPAASTVSMAAVSTQIVIGAITGLGGGAFVGFIDEVATYSAALSSDRVLAHYNAMTTPTATGTSLVVGAGQFR